MAPYVPIDCGFHDRLESLAVRGATCQLTVCEPGGEARTVLARILDVFADGGEEFARLGDARGGSETVRLDRIYAVDGVSRPASAEACGLR